MLLSVSNLTLVQNIRQYFLSPETIRFFFNLIYLALILIAVWLFFVILTHIVKIIRQIKEPSVFLEITPPAEIKVSPLATTGFFDSVYHLLGQISFKDRLLLRQMSLSFEIVSNKENGIRYYIKVPKELILPFEKSLLAYLPEAKIGRAKDYLPKNQAKVKVLNFGQKKHFALPLGENEAKDSDPIDYLISNIKRLDEDEVMAVQLVLKPLSAGGNARLARQADKLNKVLRCHTNIVWSEYNGAYKFAGILTAVVDFAVGILMIPFLAAAEFLTGNSPSLPKRSAVKKEPSAQDKEFSALAKSKLSQNLFEAGLRAAVFNGAESRGLISSFAGFCHQSGQSIAPKNNILGKIFAGYNFWLYEKRLGSSAVFSSGEAALLYHFPLTNNDFNEDLNRERSKKLPAPLSLKGKKKFDLVLGRNDYLNNPAEIGISLEQRRKHMYIIGKTGTGKTTLLKNAIYQDMKNGRGLAVFDPHGDMFRELLELVPKNRIKDVVVFDPSDRAYPIGLNILSPGVEFEDEEDREEWITASVLAIFAKMTSKEYWGPRMEHILRNTVLTALKTDNPNLFTLQKLLTDKSFQKKTAASLDDPVLKQFWNKEFALLGKMQLSNATAPLTQRLGHFITTKMSRHILLQNKTTLNISRIMDEGKILLVNLAKGDLGEDQSFFFGTILTSIIWMAAYQRTKIPEKKRRDFFLYVDEFQNFATPRFSEITSEGRKFRIGLIASHQNIAQVEDQKILKVVAGNANSIICLKASPDEEKFILPFMEPEIKKGDIVNLSPYHFCIKICSERSENAFTGVTVPLEIKPSKKTADKVLRESRKKYALKREVVDEYLEEIFFGGRKRKKTLPDSQTLIDFPSAGQEKYQRRRI